MNERVIAGKRPLTDGDQIRVGTARLTFRTSALPDGMIRCYMGAEKVVGFGHQFIKALISPPPEGPNSEAAQPGPRIMHSASAEPFQALRRKMES